MDGSETVGYIAYEFFFLLLYSHKIMHYNFYFILFILIKNVFPYLFIFHVLKDKYYIKMINLWNCWKYTLPNKTTKITHSRMMNYF